MILQIISISIINNNDMFLNKKYSSNSEKNNNNNNNNNEYLIEFTDGYISAFSKISKENPIKQLIINKKIFIGMKLQIGLAKIDKILEDFTLFINIYYNSIQKANIYSKLGPIKELFLLKNINNIKSEGGDVSKIKIILLKKYDYYIYNITKKEKYSKIKYEEILNNYEEFIENNIENNIENENNNLNNNFKEPDEIFIYFRIICVDALLYYYFLNKNINFNKNLIQHLPEKKCIIDFSVKNFTFFENLIEGNIYNLCLLNIQNKKFIQKSTKNLIKLNANESTIINEEKLNKNFKKENEYFDTIEYIKHYLNFENINIINYLFDNKFLIKFNKNEDYFFSGIYNFFCNKEIEKNINNCNKKIKEGYLFFIGLNNINIILKIEDLNFYNFKYELFNKQKKFVWKNVHFQEILYFNENNNTLLPFDMNKYKKLNEDYIKNVCIFLQTYNYSIFNSIKEEENLNLNNKPIDFYEKISKIIIN